MVKTYHEEAKDKLCIPDMCYCVLQKGNMLNNLSKGTVTHFFLYLTMKCKEAVSLVSYYEISIPDFVK